MSKITNDGLTRSGTGCVIAVCLYGNSGPQTVKMDWIGYRGLLASKTDRYYYCYYASMHVNINSSWIRTVKEVCRANRYSCAANGKTKSVIESNRRILLDFGRYWFLGTPYTHIVGQRLNAFPVNSFMKQPALAIHMVAKKLRSFNIFVCNVHATNKKTIFCNVYVTVRCATVNICCNISDHLINFVMTTLPISHCEVSM